MLTRLYYLDAFDPQVYIVKWRWGLQVHTLYFVFRISPLKLFVGTFGNYLNVLRQYAC